MEPAALQRRTGAPLVEARVDEPQRDVTALRQELAETQERLDFAEHLLARSDFTQALPGPLQPPAT